MSAGKKAQPCTELALRGDWNREFLLEQWAFILGRNSVAIVSITLNDCGWLLAEARWRALVTGTHCALDST
jgi:hypothetical protein